MYVALFIAAIAFIILFHEFGHFVTAKIFGMKAERFFLGFGPTLWSVQKGETEYGVKALPLGGFVKITGMSPYEDYDAADTERTYFSKPGWQRAIVITAGSATHFLLAGLLLFSAFAIIGLPQPVEPTPTTIVHVEEDSPAEAAGIEPGDRIAAVEGQPTDDFDDVIGALADRPGETVALTIERDGEEFASEVTLAAHPDDPARGFLGVAPEPPETEPQPMPAGQALAEVAVGELSLPRVTALSVGAIAEALSPQGLANWFGTFGEEERAEEGPVSLVGAGQIVAELGDQGQIVGVLLMLVQLNIVLGTLNMLPLPPLDGGHFAVILAEGAVNGWRRLRGRSERFFVDPAALTPIALVVILFFGTVMLAALYLDIVQPASELLP